MHNEAKAYIVAATVLLATIGSGRASPVLTLDLQGASLGTAPLTADTLLLGDYAKITTSSDGATFSDVGYLPVEGFALGGNTLSPAGFDAPDGSGWGAYIQYSAAGTQTLSASGRPEAATYSQLSYQLIGYKGSATFGIDAGGNAVVSGTVLQPVVLGQGSLIDGMLAFVPTSPTSANIEGGVSATFTSATPSLATSAPALLTLSIDHPPSDWYFTSPSTLEIAAASGATATLESLLVDTGSGEQDDPPSPVPEPASVLVIGAVLTGLGAGRRRLRRGSSNAASR